MKKLLYISSLLAASLTMWSQQLPLYTNYLQHQVIYNPAYAGAIQGRTFNLSYRNQWTGFEGAPKTIAASGYGTIRKKPNLSTGGIVFSEKIGLIDYTSLYGLFTYRLKINEKASVNFGMSGGGVQYSVRMFSARIYDRDDNFLSSGVLNSTSFDLNSGFYFYTPKFFLGFSSQHMTNSRIRWTNTEGHMTPHFYLYSGYNFILGKKNEWQLQPSALLRTNSPARYVWEGHLKATYQDMVWLSVFYRSRTSTGAAIGFIFDKQFNVSYAYDYVLSSINTYAGGTHEVTLSYHIPYNKKKSKSEQIQDADEEELKNTNSSKQPTLKGKKEDQPQKEEQK